MIAAFLAQSLGLNLPARLFVQAGLRREGLRGHIILNPIEFESWEDVLKNLESFWPEGIVRWAFRTSMCGPIAWFSVPGGLEVKRSLLCPPMECTVEVRLSPCGGYPGSRPFGNRMNKAPIQVQLVSTHAIAAGLPAQSTRQGGFEARHEQPRVNVIAIEHLRR